MKYITKLSVTNDRNDNCNVEWDFSDDEESSKWWRMTKEEEAQIWNYKTPGAVSYRFYEFRTWTSETILDASMDELEGMTLKQFKEIIS